MKKSPTDSFRKRIYRVEWYIEKELDWSKYTFNTAEEGKSIISKLLRKCNLDIEIPEILLNERSNANKGWFTHGKRQITIFGNGNGFSVSLLLHELSHYIQYFYSDCKLRENKCPGHCGHFVLILCYLYANYFYVYNLKELATEFQLERNRTKRGNGIPVWLTKVNGIDLMEK